MMIRLPRHGEIIRIWVHVKGGRGKLTGDAVRSVKGRRTPFTLPIPTQPRHGLCRRPEKVDGVEH